VQKRENSGKNALGKSKIFGNSCEFSGQWLKKRHILWQTRRRTGVCRDRRREEKNKIFTEKTKLTLRGNPPALWRFNLFR
jgi:hypothetical protein